MKRVRIGTKVRLTNEDYPIYEKVKDKVFKVTHIAHNIQEHPGYDEGVGGILIDVDGLEFSLYEWEFEVVR